MQSYKKYFIPTREIRNICKSGILGYPKTSPAPKKVPQKPPNHYPYTSFNFWRVTKNPTGIFLDFSFSKGYRHFWRRHNMSI